VLEPLFGDNVKGPWGTFIDFLVVFATIFGVATSLGLGAIQISGGLSYVFGWDQNILIQLIIILIVTVLYMTSAMTGLNKWIIYLINLKILLAVMLMVFVIFLSTTNFIMVLFTSTVGRYILNLPGTRFPLTPFEESVWIDNWPIFYWA